MIRNVHKGNKSIGLSGNLGVARSIISIESLKTEKPNQGFEQQYDLEKVIAKDSD